MVKPDWAIAAPYGPARAQPPRRREPWGGRAAQSRLGGGGGSPSSVATVPPHTRGRGWRAADAAGSTGACAYARPRRRFGVGVGVVARRPVDRRRASGLRPASAWVRRATRVGATVVGAKWCLLRRGFDYPDATAKAGTRVRVVESRGGVRTPRPVTTGWGARCSTCWVVIVVAGWRRPRRGFDYPGDEAKAGARVRVLSARGHPVSLCSRTGRGLTAEIEWGWATARSQTARLRTQ